MYLISILLLIKLKFDKIIIADERVVPRQRLAVIKEKKTISYCASTFDFCL